MIDRHARAETPASEQSESAILGVMVAVTSLFPWHVPSDAEEPRVLLHDVPWATYVVLRDSVDSPNVRMTYLNGRLEIISTSRRHEVSKAQIARLVELLCLERDIPLFSYGHMTVREEGKERGLEPDVWYCRGQDRELPEIAIEVIVTNPLLDKLEVYRGLGIREVCVFKNGAFTIVGLRGDQYEVIAGSEVFPEVDFARIAHYVQDPDQHAALKAFRDELRAGTP